MTATEKWVLDMLADRHNKDDGFAFPSISLIAEECGDLTERHVRRILRSLEEKGVLEATMALRPGKNDKLHKGQTSNRYRFCEIDPPFPKDMVETTRKQFELSVRQNKQARQAQMNLLPPDIHVRGVDRKMPVEYSAKLSGAPGHSGPGRGGHKGPGREDTDVRGPLTPVSGAIEPLLLNQVTEPGKKEPAREPAHPTLPRSGRVEIPKREREAWNAFHLALKVDLGSVPANLAHRFTLIRGGEGGGNGDTNDFDTCFRGWWLVEVKRMPNGILLVTEAEDEAATAQGLAKYKGRLEQTARRYFSPTNRKMPVTFKLLRSTRPKRAAVTRPVVVGSLAASAQEAAAAVASVGRRDAWTRVQVRLQELLALRSNAADSLRNYVDAIEPMTLVRERVHGAELVWELRPKHQKKAQAVMSMFRREMDQAIRDVTGRAVRIQLLGT